MSYEVVWEPRGALKRFEGVVSSADLIRSVVETEADARFDSLRFVINDFRDVSRIDFDAEDVSEVATIDLGASRTNPSIRIAVVATNAEVIALAEHYANSPLNVYPTQIFATMEAARAWVAEPGEFRSTHW
ncbi:hypothetical protein OOZ63_11735 [Paucibacter sp. PLA-PC-4]|uniref:hypothetical protein n=1 Tax=Paucibacter sp. PLA-PC-4 TaxID=2993655 RepID=UPI002248EA8D|nr:hypothetical protein [Paucibacter sp. PLA-PC-4]MCX2862513.1 hypothetical protein [Paucibacter sp. PLA-PC-4]